MNIWISLCFAAVWCGCSHGSCSRIPTSVKKSIFAHQEKQGTIKTNKILHKYYRLITERLHRKAINWQGAWLRPAGSVRRSGVKQSSSCSVLSGHVKFQTLRWTHNAITCLYTGTIDSKITSHVFLLVSWTHNQVRRTYTSIGKA